MEVFAASMVDNITAKVSSPVRSQRNQTESDDGIARRVFGRRTNCNSAHKMTGLQSRKGAAARSLFAFEGAVEEDKCGCRFCLRPLEVAGHPPACSLLCANELRDSAK